jgi:pimeloyl-ACP methyl ester carboxylesterase
MREPSSGTVYVNGINIYYEVHGSGEPLLLIEGLGYSSWMWYKQVPVLSKSHKVIIFDNRGAGNTDKPDSEYTIELMAADAAGLLKEMGVESAHVLGVSLGGYVAQELAISEPDMVRNLMLVSTNSGPGKPITGKSPFFNGFLKLWGFLPTAFDGSRGPVRLEYAMSDEERMRYGLSLAFSEEYFKNNSDEIDRIMEWRLENPQPEYAWRRQLLAGIGYDSSPRSGEITSRTLLVNGAQDRIVSPESALKLSKKIPDSTLVVLEGAGHLLFIERPEEFNAHVLGFLTDSEVKADNPEGSGNTLWKKVKSLIPANGKRKSPGTEN